MSKRSTEAPLLAGEPAPASGGTVVLVLMCGVSYTGNALIGLVLPFLPHALEELNPVGMTVELLNAVLMSSFPLAMLIFSPAANWLAGKMGRYAVLKIGLIMQTFATLLFAYAPVLGHEECVPVVSMFLAGRVIQGIGASMANLAIFAIVADAFASSLAMVMGVNEIAIGLAFTSAPVVGSILFALGGFRLPFIIVSALVFLMVPLAMVAEHMQGGATQDDDGEKDEGPSALMRMKGTMTSGLLVAFIGEALAMGVFGVFNGILAVHLDNIGLTPAMSGITFGLFSGTYSCSAPLIGCIADRWRGVRPSVAPRGGYQDVMSIGVLGTGLCALAITFGGFFAPMGVTTRWAYELLVLCVMGVTQSAALIPSLPAFTASAGRLTQTSSSVDYESDDGVDTDSVATFFNIAMQTGLAFGPLIGGALSSSLSFEVAEMLIGGVCVLYGAIALLSRLCAKPIPASEPGRRPSMAIARTSNYSDTNALPKKLKRPSMALAMRGGMPAFSGRESMAKAIAPRGAWLVPGGVTPKMSDGRFTL